MRGSPMRSTTCSPTLVTCGAARGIMWIFIRVQCRPTSFARSEEHTSELQSQSNLVCRLLLEKKKYYETALDRPGKHPRVLPLKSHILLLHYCPCHSHSYAHPTLHRLPGFSMISIFAPLPPF